MSQKIGLRNASKPRKRFVGKNTATPSRAGTSSTVSNQIPTEILADPDLNAAIAQLPSNYSFEVHKTIHHIRKNGATMVAIQMPEGLQMFACTLADIIEQFTSALTVIMGDVTYGACCIDDYTAVALGCDMLIHYGHSCLVPMDTTLIKTLYIFVEIAIDSSHLAHTIRHNFPNDREAFREQLLAAEQVIARLPDGAKVDVDPHLWIEGCSSAREALHRGRIDVPELTKRPDAIEHTRLALVSTIQFVAALQQLKENLTTNHSSVAHLQPVDERYLSGPLDAEEQMVIRPKMWTGTYEAYIPRSRPLSPGEILGCTAPRLHDVDALLYLGDGRFHLESIMIVNPSVPAFRYDPYSKKLTREHYGHKEMKAARNDAVRIAKSSVQDFSTKPEDVTQKPGRFDSLLPSSYSPVWGIILGTLGRQGSLSQLQAIAKQLDASITPVPYVTILLSELSPPKLALFKSRISAFVQTSCPRLSIDWGYAFHRPLLSPYETAVAVGQTPGWMDDDFDDRSESREGVYPMNFYEAGSIWANARSKASYE